MSDSISVNKASVAEFLATGAKMPFLIPEYQRPYAWTQDQVDTLFEDVLEFALNEELKESNGEDKGTYFLGSIVSFENGRRQQEIIDGQQRLTSLSLLLRAIYTKLQTSDPDSKQTKNFMSKIEPILWKNDEMTGDVDFEKPLIYSNVIDDKQSQVFYDILATGHADSKAKDPYSQNYIRFQKLYETMCTQHINMPYKFILRLLNQVILLPIKADNQDTALTIFLTLNDRGLPLSDADIFKAKIYDNLSDEERKTFIYKWKQLEFRANDADETVQHLFSLYMFYLKAKAGNKKTTNIAIRRFYFHNVKEYLLAPDLLDKLNRILNLWTLINTHESIEGEAWSTNFEILKALDILASYPNEIWKSPVLIYYLNYSHDANFETDFEKFLHKLIVELEKSYLVNSTITAAKPGIYSLNVALMHNKYPEIKIKTTDNQAELDAKIKRPANMSLRRLLLKTLIYQDSKQDTLLKPKLEIEHIFPRHWEKANTPDGFTPEKVNEVIDSLGNFTLLEKRLNIYASDVYFERKRKSYLKSQVTMSRELAEKDNWKIEDSWRRTDELLRQLKDIYAKWSEEYKVEG